MPTSSFLLSSGWTWSHGVNYWQPPHTHSHHALKKPELHSPNHDMDHIAAVMTVSPQPRAGARCRANGFAQLREEGARHRPAAGLRQGQHPPKCEALGFGSRFRGFVTTLGEQYCGKRFCFLRSSSCASHVAETHVVLRFFDVCASGLRFGLKAWTQETCHTLRCG